MTTTQTFSNGKVRLVSHLVTGNVYLMTAEDQGIFVKPGEDNIEGWRHINGKTRKLNPKNYVPYCGEVVLAN